ncbi:MAG: enoyl-CoA hydratase/isomerase family protein [bacterium]|nr:enoyl-CoA hydratase/isomerase family protein [bacterium]
MEYSTLLLEKKENIAIITMNREERLNPLDISAGKEIIAVLENLEKDRAIRSLIITGCGKAFSAGGDVKGMLQSIEDECPDKYMDDLTRALYDIALILRNYPKPVIAAVNGYAVGAGMNLALSCDLILASEKAVFGQSFNKLGLIPGFGGTHLLINQVTWQQAAEIAFFGEQLPAQKMYELGFINRIVPPDKLEEEALLLAQKLSQGPTLAYARTKKLFLRALKTGFEEHLEHERSVQVESALTEDYKAGVKALNTKTKPEFKGE